MAEAILHIQGMTCEKCVETIENALTELEGVERALADIKEETVHVQYNEEQVKREELKQAIQESGYSVL